MLTIRPACEADFEDLWRIFQQVIAPGDSYVFAPETPRDEAHEYWLGRDRVCCVATDGPQVVGMYRLVANQVGLGAHVANASFMVDLETHCQGVGRAMGAHCLREARRKGFVAMQFNFVVSTNAGAVALWQKLGFQIVGTLPKAFRHARLGLVDAYVMYRFLDDIPL